MPIDHVKLPVSDLDTSRTFYSAALAPFGYRLVYDEEPTLGFAFVLDPDGHNIEAVYHGPKKRRPDSS
jgi:catechol 2,3-dioxygenase-like lactoylglutathione lyase family enzyme